MSTIKWLSIGALLCSVTTHAEVQCRHLFTDQNFFLKTKAYEQNPFHFNISWTSNAIKKYVLANPTEVVFHRKDPQFIITGAENFIKDLTKSAGGSVSKKKLTTDLVAPVLYEWIYGQTLRQINAKESLVVGRLQTNGAVSLPESQGHFYNRKYGQLEVTETIQKLQRISKSAHSDPEVRAARKRADDATNVYNRTLSTSDYQHVEKEEAQYEKILHEKRQMALGVFAQKYGDGHFNALMNDGKIVSLSQRMIEQGEMLTVPSLLNGRNHDSIGPQLVPAFQANLRPFFWKFLHIYQPNSVGAMNSTAKALADLLGDRQKFYAVFSLEHRLFDGLKNSNDLLQNSLLIKSQLAVSEYNVLAAFAHSFMQINDPNQSAAMNLQRQNEVAQSVLTEMAFQAHMDKKIDFKPRASFPVSPTFLELMNQVNTSRP